MSVLGTGVAAGVAQSAQQAEQVARRKDKKARDKRAQADAVELHALGQEKVEKVDQPEAGPAAEGVGVATDTERGDKITDEPPPGPQSHRLSAGAGPDAMEAEAVSAAEAMASYEKSEHAEDEAREHEAREADAPAEEGADTDRPHVDLEA